MKHEIDIKIESAKNDISNAIKNLKMATDEGTEGYKETKDWCIDKILQVIIELMVINRKI